LPEVREASQATLGRGCVENRASRRLFFEPRLEIRADLRLALDWVEREARSATTDA